MEIKTIKLPDGVEVVESVKYETQDIIDYCERPDATGVALIRFVNGVLGTFSFYMDQDLSYFEDKSELSEDEQLILDTIDRLDINTYDLLYKIAERASIEIEIIEE